MKRETPRLSEDAPAAHTLADLCAGFIAPEVVEGAWESVEPDAMPDSFRRLLVHRNHMTTTLRAFHGAPVELRVLSERLDGDVYRRKIVLTLSGTQHVVEFGIVRIELRFAPSVVRDSILEGRRPLGEVLIDNAVLRRIEPRSYLRLSASCAMLADARFSATGDVFGRIGTIFCNGERAIELLEVVTDATDGRHE